MKIKKHLYKRILGYILIPIILFIFLFFSAPFATTMFLLLLWGIYAGIVYAPFWYKIIFIFVALGIITCIIEWIKFLVNEFLEE